MAVVGCRPRTDMHQTTKARMTPGERGHGKTVSWWASKAQKAFHPEPYLDQVERAKDAETRPRRAEAVTDAATDGGRSIAAAASRRSRRTDRELASYFTADQSAVGEAVVEKRAADGIDSRNIN